MRVGLVKEQFPGERRVALVPESVAVLAKAGREVTVETGAGIAAGFEDAEYTEAGAALAGSRDEIFSGADVVVAVRLAGAAPEFNPGDVERTRAGQVLIAAMEPLWVPAEVARLVEAGAAPFALELVPRITRAQSMDILSSMATLSGYKAVLLAAEHLPRLFPMLMTAAGTLRPARVLIVGAGVAGLQAIATAKRLGATVSAYDVRPAVKEQVESVGAKFVELELDTAGAEGAGGYAKEQSEEQVRRQQELMARVVAESNVVITTAAIPGRQAPRIVTDEMVAAMARGSVIVDLAADKGGNCAPTRADEVVLTDNGVTVLGPTNLPATVPYHASQMLSRNVTTLLGHLVHDDKIALDTDDEITRGTLVGSDAEVRHPLVRNSLGLAPLAPAGGGDTPETTARQEGKT